MKLFVPPEWPLRRIACTSYKIVTAYGAPRYPGPGKFHLALRYHSQKNGV